MKHFHFPTALMHLLLLLLAGLTLRDWPDFFLGFSVLVLAVHLIWAVRSGRSFLSAHCAGIGLSLLAGSFGWIPTDSGPLGLSGGGFAWFFYCCALLISLLLLVLLHIARRIRKP